MWSADRSTAGIHDRFPLLCLLAGLAVVGGFSVVGGLGEGWGSGGIGRTTRVMVGDVMGGK